MCNLCIELCVFNLFCQTSYNAVAYYHLPIHSRRLKIRAANRTKSGLKKANLNPKLCPNRVVFPNPDLKLAYRVQFSKI